MHHICTLCIVEHTKWWCNALWWSWRLPNMLCVIMEHTKWWCNTLVVVVVTKQVHHHFTRPECFCIHVSSSYIYKTGILVHWYKQISVNLFFWGGEGSIYKYLDRLQFTTKSKFCCSCYWYFGECNLKLHNKEWDKQNYVRKSEITKVDCF